MSQSSNRQLTETHRLVLVCMDCGQRKTMDAAGNELSVSESVARSIESRSTEEKPFRVLRVGCLDLCPKDRVTVAIPVITGVPSAEAFGTRYHLVDPKSPLAIDEIVSYS